MGYRLAFGGIKMICKNCEHGLYKNKKGFFVHVAQGSKKCYVWTKPSENKVEKLLGHGLCGCVMPEPKKVNRSRKKVVK